VLALAALALASAARAEDGTPLYRAPEPGSYELPAIARVHERELIDSSGARVRFPGLAAGQVAVVALVYGSCHEATGCPASMALLRELDRRLAADPAREKRVRLHVLPQLGQPLGRVLRGKDTPERLAELRKNMEPQGDWRFLVPGTADELAPLLRDFGQDVAELGGGVKRHVAKVYLVDAALHVRNIYAPGMLDPSLVLADIDTLTNH